jgi:hypothetical protein
MVNVKPGELIFWPKLSAKKFHLRARYEVLFLSYSGRRLFVDSSDRSEFERWPKS